jgi:adenylate kinase family enzyme
MARFVVVGTSGSGKSAFARRLAARAGAPYVELDALYWDADWTPRPVDEFAAAVRAATEAQRWVVDGNYSVVRDVLWPRATHIVWLNFSRRVVFTRVVARTLRRVVSRQELWAANRESLRKAFLSRDSILLWSFTTFGKNQAKYAKLRSGSAYPHLRWHELRTPAQAEGFLRGFA